VQQTPTKLNIFLFPSFRLRLCVFAVASGSSYFSAFFVDSVQKSSSPRSDVFAAVCCWLLLFVLTLFLSSLPIPPPAHIYNIQNPSPFSLYPCRFPRWKAVLPQESSLFRSSDFLLSLAFPLFPLFFFFWFCVSLFPPSTSFASCFFFFLVYSTFALKRRSPKLPCFFSLSLFFFLVSPSCQVSLKRITEDCAEYGAKLFHCLLPFGSSLKLGRTFCGFSFLIPLHN
jgi:hypothetical protein